MTSPFTVRKCHVDEVDVYLALTIEIDDTSGVDGEPHSHPYQRDDRHHVEQARSREIVRWTTPLDAVGWRRAWALCDGEEPVGFLQLDGGQLRSELHRAEIGMGIRSAHRRRGGGSMLLDTAIAWAREQAGLDWLDLGVFSDNPGAQGLYTRHGFEVVGRVPDRYRVDGASLDDIMMTRNVSM